MSLPRYPLPASPYSPGQSAEGENKPVLPRLLPGEYPEGGRGWQLRVTLQ